LRDETRRNAMSDNAYKLGRSMVWSNTAGLYMRSFEVARRRAPALAPAAVQFAEFVGRTPPSAAGRSAGFSRAAST
jgi:hypothetical protein